MSDVGRSPRTSERAPRVSPLVLSSLALAIVAVAIAVYALTELAAVRDELSVLRAAVGSIVRERTTTSPAALRPPRPELDPNE